MSSAALCTEKSTAAGEHPGTPAIGEKAEVADADQALRENVNKEPAQKLVGRNSHDLLLAAMRIVFPAKRDSIILQGNQSMVGDGDAVGIPRQIL
jgi:hypothetical protein